MKFIMKPFKHSITVGNKKYDYLIKPINKKVVFFECKGAGISQEFLVEDIPALLIDLPELIIAELKFQKEIRKQGEIIRFRVSQRDKAKIQQKAIKHGYPTISEYIRALALGRKCLNR